MTTDATNLQMTTAQRATSDEGRTETNLSVPEHGAGVEPPLLPCPFCGGEAHEGPRGIRCLTHGCPLRIGAALSVEQWNRRSGQVVARAAAGATTKDAAGEAPLCPICGHTDRIGCKRNASRVAECAGPATRQARASRPTGEQPKCCAGEGYPGIAHDLEKMRTALIAAQEHIVNVDRQGVADFKEINRIINAALGEVK